MFFQNNTHSIFTIKLCSFINLISQKFSDSAVIAIAVCKRCTLDLPVVNRQGSSTGFLFTYHSAIQGNCFQRLFFYCTCWHLGYHKTLLLIYQTLINDTAFHFYNFRIKRNIFAVTRSEITICCHLFCNNLFQIKLINLFFSNGFVEGVIWNLAEQFDLVKSFGIWYH